MKWILIFGVILALGHGHLILAFDNLALFFGFPAWVLYYMVVHLIFVMALKLFAKEIDNQQL